MKSLYHPTGGMFTQHMDTLKEGEKLKVTGVGGRIEYLGDSNFSIRLAAEPNQNEIKRFERVGMIAAGSGIAPMFQLIDHVSQHKDHTKLSLIYSSKTPVSGSLFI